MSRMFLEIGLIVALLLLNGLLAMSELAIVTARRPRLERMARAGSPRARAAVELAERPTRFLSTVQVGITLVGILAGALGGATVSRELAALLSGAPWLAPHADTVAFVIVVSLTTYLSLILGELVPKRIALAKPERIALLVARPMAALARVGHPLVRVLVGSTDLVLRVLGLHRSEATEVTDEDVRALIAQGRAGGSIHAGEEEIVERVLLLGDRPAGSIMTPRIDVEWIEPDEDPESIRHLLRAGRHASLLVCEGMVDQVVGVVSTRDLLRQHLEGRSFDVRGASMPPLFLPETTTLLKVLDQFRGARASVAVLLDEFGGVQGVVTLADILEDLIGELPGTPPEESRESAVVARPDGGWLVDGAAAVEDVAEELGLQRPEGDHAGEYRTVAGLVLTHLGRLPHVGESLEALGCRFEVMDMDGRRIDRLLVTRLPPAVPDA